MVSRISIKYKQFIKKCISTIYGTPTGINTSDQSGHEINCIDVLPSSQISWIGAYTRSQVSYTGYDLIILTPL